MGKLTLTPPPRFRGSQQEQMLQCYTYLYTMQEQLSACLRDLDEGKVSVSPQPGASRPQAQKEEALRALIVKNADLVRTEMDSLRTELQGSFVASSEFGDYLRQVSSAIEADPTAISQYYGFVDEIRGRLQEDIGKVGESLEAYSRSVSGYIRSGTVDYTEAGEPVFGVAVGQELTEEEGPFGSKITNRFRSVFTAQELAFWQNDNKVAWLSSSSDSLHIGQADISLLTLGPWELGHREGFYIKWIGG